MIVGPCFHNAWASRRGYVNRVPNSVHTSSLHHIIDQAFPIFLRVSLKNTGGVGTRLGECPVFTEFKGELAIDEGGVQEVFFLLFGEKKLFEGATILTPVVHPQMDMSVFPIIGYVLSHGYLVAGTHTALPTLMCMLLGAATTVATDILLDLFLDFISASDRQTFKVALSFTNEKIFPPNL